MKRDRSAYMKARREANLEAFKDKDRRHYCANRESIKARQRAYYRRTKAALAWYHANKERVTAVKAVYAEAHPEKLAAAQRKWRLRNGPRLAMHARNYYARKIGAAGEPSADVVAVLLKEQRGKCKICSCRLSESGYEVDHIMPLSLGGSNADENLQLLCPSCNRHKKNIHPVEYMRRIGRAV